MDEFIAGFFTTAKPIGVIIAIAAGTFATMWVVVHLAWEALAANSVLAKLVLAAIVLLAVCAIGGGANFLYHNLAWKA